ncbi:MAG: two-component system sensor histidine kinase NtrB [Maricaulaceae bacterium]
MNENTNLTDKLADDIPAPLLMFKGAELDLLWLNQAAQEWLGRSANMMDAASFRETILNASLLSEAAERCLQARAPISLRGFMLRRKQTSDQKCHITLFPSQDRLAMSLRFGQSQPNETQGPDKAVSAMGRMLAHEIKNPLAGIKGAAQLLRDDIQTDEGQKLIDLIGSEIDRIRRLADRMETLGDRDPRNESLVNIHEILRDARQLIQSASAQNIIFTESYDPSLPETMGDADTLMQAVVNIIKNSKEAIEDNGGSGEICLETAFRSGVIRKGGLGQSDHSLPIEIRIIDNGPGIPNDIRDQIFQPFVTNKPSGQGLGLALVAKVAAAHEGIVEVTSREGRTVFSLLLPVTS